MGTAGSIIFNLMLRGVQPAISGLRGFSNGLRGMQNNVRGFGTIGAMFGNVMRNMAAGVANLAGRVASFAVHKLVQGVKLGVTEGLRFNMMMEDMHISFESLTGSKGTATKMTNQIVKLAAETPFATENFSKAAKTLLGYGVTNKEILPDLRILGDLSNGNADRMDRLATAFAQTTAAGKLNGEEMRQYRNAGLNPLKLISEQTGESMESLDKKMRDGAISADMVREAFIKATSKGGRFNENMKKASKSLSGQIEKLKEYSSIFMGKVTEPLFNALRNRVIPALVDFAKNGGEAGKKLSTGITSTIGKIVKSVMPQFKESLKGVVVQLKKFKVTPAMQTSFDNFKTALQNFGKILRSSVVKTIQSLVTQYLPSFLSGVQKLTPILTVMGTIFVTIMGKVISVITKLIVWFGKVEQKTGLLKTLFVTIGAVIGGALLVAVLALGAAFVAIVAPIVVGWLAISVVIKVVIAVVKAIIAAVKALPGIFAAIGGGIKAAWTAVWNGIKGVFMTAWNGVKTAAIGVKNFFVNTFNTLKATVGGIVRGVVNTIVNIFQGLKNKAVAIVKGVVTKIVGFFKWLYNHNYPVKNLVDLIIGLWKLLKKFSIILWNTIKTAVVNKVKALKKAAMVIFNALKSAIKTVWNGIKTAARVVWNGIKNNIINPVKALWKKSIAIFNLLKAGVLIVWNTIKTQALQKWNGLKNGISNGINTIKSKVKSGFTTVKNIIVGFAKQALTWGKMLMDNLIQGIKNKFAPLGNILKTVGKLIAKFLGFHSPTEAGAGKDADKWMPNLIDMMVEGVNHNLYKLESMSEKMMKALDISEWLNNYGITVGDQAISQLTNIVNKGIKGGLDDSIKSSVQLWNDEWDVNSRFPSMYDDLYNTIYERNMTGFSKNMDESYMTKWLDDFSLEISNSEMKDLANIINLGFKHGLTELVDTKLDDWRDDSEITTIYELEKWFIKRIRDMIVDSEFEYMKPFTASSMADWTKSWMTDINQAGVSSITSIINEAMQKGITKDIRDRLDAFEENYLSSNDYWYSHNIMMDIEDMIKKAYEPGYVKRMNTGEMKSWLSGFDKISVTNSEITKLTNIINEGFKDGFTQAVEVALESWFDNSEITTHYNSEKKVWDGLYELINDGVKEVNEFNKNKSTSKETSNAIGEVVSEAISITINKALKSTVSNTISSIIGGKKNNNITTLSNHIKESINNTENYNKAMSELIEILKYGAKEGLSRNVYASMEEWIDNWELEEPFDVIGYGLEDLILSLYDEYKLIGTSARDFINTAFYRSGSDYDKYDQFIDEMYDILNKGAITGFNDSIAASISTWSKKWGIFNDDLIDSIVYNLGSSIDRLHKTSSMVSDSALEDIIKDSMNEQFDTGIYTRSAKELRDSIKTSFKSQYEQLGELDKYTKDMEELDEIFVKASKEGYTDYIDALLDQWSDNDIAYVTNDLRRDFELLANALHDQKGIIRTSVKDFIDTAYQKTGGKPGMYDVFINQLYELLNLGKAKGFDYVKPLIKNWANKWGLVSSDIIDVIMYNLEEQINKSHGTYQSSGIGKEINDIIDMISNGSKRIVKGLEIPLSHYMNIPSVPSGIGTQNNNVNININGSNLSVDQIGNKLTQKLQSLGIKAQKR